MSFPLVKFSQILKLEYGKALPDIDRDIDGLYAAYGANGEKSRSNKFLYDKPSIIVGRKGSAGELTLVKDKFWALDVTYYVTHDEKNTDLMYLYYALKTKNLTSYARGVKPGINRNDVYELEVPFPPLSTQQKIVAKLDVIFAEIDKATAAAEANAKNAEALFQSYLTQVFENGGEGWTETTLEKVCKITNGSTPKRDKREFWENGDICWFTVDDIRKSGRVLSETIQHVTKAALDYTSLKVLPADSVLICCTASVGEYAIIKKPMATNQQFNGLTVIDNNLLPDFLFWYAASMKPLLLSVSGKVTIDFIPISRLKSLPIKFPKVDQQLILVDKLNHIYNNTGISKQAFESKVVELLRLKQSILNQAFSGELVKE